MDFQNQYPNLFNFLAGHFPDSDFDELTDEEIIADFKSKFKSDELIKLINELKHLISKQADWDEAADAANRYFHTSNQIGIWLNFIYDEFCKK